MRIIIAAGLGLFLLFSLAFAQQQPDDADQQQPIAAVTTATTLIGTETSISNKPEDTSNATLLASDHSTANETSTTSAVKVFDLAIENTEEPPATSSDPETITTSPAPETIPTSPASEASTTTSEAYSPNSSAPETTTTSETSLTTSTAPETTTTSETSLTTSLAPETTTTSETSSTTSTAPETTTSTGSGLILAPRDDSIMAEKIDEVFDTRIMGFYAAHTIWMMILSVFVMCLSLIAVLLFVMLLCMFTRNKKTLKKRIDTLEKDNKMYGESIAHMRRGEGLMRNNTPIYGTMNRQFEHDHVYQSMPFHNNQASPYMTYDAKCSDPFIAKLNAKNCNSMGTFNRHTMGSSLRKNGSGSRKQMLELDDYARLMSSPGGKIYDDGERYDTFIDPVDMTVTRACSLGSGNNNSLGLTPLMPVPEMGSEQLPESPSHVTTSAYACTPVE